MQSEWRAVVRFLLSQSSALHFASRSLAALLKRFHMFSIHMSLMYAPRAAGTHQRSWLFPLGNQGYGGIDKGNKLASRVFLIIVLILSKGGRFLMEQPANSYLAVHPRMQQLFEWFDVYFCQIWSGAYADNKSDASSKPTFLWSNDEELLVRIQAVSGHLSRSVLESFGRSLVNKRQKTDGSSTFSGNALMKSSQYLSCILRYKLQASFFGVSPPQNPPEQLGSTITSLACTWRNCWWR